ncbi:MAG: hypothetical protein RL294_215 [Actinomycetota bacterium]|jgi:hypothetical protein
MAEPAPDLDPLTQIHVAGGSPSPEQEAAVIAVVAGMLREGGAVEEDKRVDGWTRDTRAPREPVAGRTWSNPLR